MGPSLTPRRKGSIARCGAALNGCASPEIEESGGKGRDGVKANNHKDPRMDCASPNRLRQTGRLRALHRPYCRIFMHPGAAQHQACCFLERAAAAAKDFCPFPLPFFSLLNQPTNKPTQSHLFLRISSSVTPRVRLLFPMLIYDSIFLIEQSCVFQAGSRRGAFPGAERRGGR